ncbi:unnamed protein product [Aspergillus oryzae]|nr:unnamed protein product [Aspergillus oryzae]
MASIANFVVFTRRSSDPSLGWEDNPPNTPVYTYVASAINIALSILESPHGRHYLTQLALIIDHEMDENSHFQGNKDIAKHWVDVFLAKVRAQFPVVIVDFTMNNPNELGCHPRGGWMGHLKDFDPRSHMICSPVSPRDMRSMGSGSFASTTLESRRAMMARGFDLGRPKGYRVKVSDIMNVARDPRKMLKAC